MRTKADHVSHSRARKPAWRRLPQPEADFGRADLDGVAVAQDGFAKRLAVDGRQRIGLRRQHKARDGIKRQFKMLVPDSIVLQPQVRLRARAPPGKENGGQPFRRPPFFRRQS